MRRLLIGIVAAIIVIGTGAYFGWDLWAQFRTKSQVERVFDSLRMAFPTASHGRIELSGKTRSVKISNIILQSGDRATTIKIDQLVAVGTRGPVAGRVAAVRIELTNWELSTTVPIAAGPALSYKAPSVVIDAFSGPPTFPQKVNTASMIDVLRASLEYFAASTANAITVPKLTATVTPRPSGEPSLAIGTAEYTYTDLALREIRNGHIGTISTARSTFTSDPAVPDLGSFAGAMAQFSLVDFDIGALLAMFDPSNAKTDTYLPMYKQASAGPFELRFSRGQIIQVDTIAVNDIAVRPLKLSIFSFLAMADSAPKPGTPPTPAQLHAIMEQVANVYEGIRIGKFELRGIKMRMQMLPDADFKLAAFRLSGLENGRIAEFAIEGLDGQSPQKEPVHIGRFAFKGLQISNLMRQSSQLIESGGTPSKDQAIGLLALLEGIELNDVIATATKQTIRIDSFQLSWGQFVGPIPTNVRLSAKTSVPTNLADAGTGGMLSGAGMDTLTTSVDLGVAWNEATQTLDISPAAIELVNSFAFTAKLSVRNVPRSIFSTDTSQAMAAADQLEAGPIELSLRDTGGLKMALTQYAKGKGLSEDDARKQIIESVNETAKSTAQSNPDALVVGQALVQFIEAPGSTLTITVTPKGKVNFKQAFEAANGDPASTASLFTIEAKTTR
jgi:hypothetical protein